MIFSEIKTILEMLIPNVTQFFCVKIFVSLKITFDVQNLKKKNKKFPVQ